MSSRDKRNNRQGASVVDTEVQTGPDVVDTETEVASTPIVESTEATQPTQPSFVSEAEVPTPAVDPNVSSVNSEPVVVGSDVPVVETPVFTEKERDFHDRQTYTDVSDLQAKGYGPNIISNISSLRSYAYTMRRNNVKLTDQEFINQQVWLVQFLQSIINNTEDGALFKQIWRALLDDFHTFREHALQSEMVFRGIDTLPLTQSNIEFAKRILNLLTVTANPQTRIEQASRLDWDYVLAYGVNERGQSLITAFYQI